MNLKGIFMRQVLCAMRSPNGSILQEIYRFGHCHGWQIECYEGRFPPGWFGDGVLSDSFSLEELKEIREIAENGPKTEDIEKNREFMLKSWKNSLEQNGAWMNYIQIKYGSGLNYIADHEQAIRDLTNADVQALAKKILADGNLVKVVMRPSK